MSDNDTLLLNSTDAAKLLGIHPSVWFDLKKTGDLPPSVILRKREYYNRDTLLQWAKNLEEKGPPHANGNKG